MLIVFCKISITGNSRARTYSNSNTGKLQTKSMMSFEIRFITVFLELLLLCNVKAGSFCTNPSEYECKEQGITKCAPKANRSATDKPLPIEKPPCAVACQDNFSWCEERGSCIGKGEVCDCGPDKIYCTSKDAYSCESRKGILDSHIFAICPDGSCQHVRSNCSASSQDRVREGRELRGIEGCRSGQFKCGTSCLDNAQIAEFRDCDGECLSVHRSCYKAGDNPGERITESKNSLVTILISILIAVLLCSFTVIGVLYYKYVYTRDDKKERDEENIQTPAKNTDSSVLHGDRSPPYTSTPRYRNTSNKKPIIKQQLNKAPGKKLFNNSHLDSSYGEDNFVTKNKNYQSVANESPSKQSSYKERNPIKKNKYLVANNLARKETKHNNSNINHSYEDDEDFANTLCHK